MNSVTWFTLGYLTGLAVAFIYMYFALIRGKVWREAKIDKIEVSK